jgi:glutamate/tyrosine decarboxylase-like PLP-dependent enzyme
MTDTKFPARGTPWPELRRELVELQAQDTPWTRGLFGLWWPNPSPDVFRVQKEAAALYAHASQLYAPWVPSLATLEADVQAMVLDLLRAPAGAVCTLSSGGTESNFLAVLTARNWARVHRPEVAEPEMVMPYTAHPTLNKAAHFLGVKVVRVPVTADYRADVAQLEWASGPNTIMLVGSAPPYSHGRVDPVPALGELALRRNLWLHVDAAVGGFLAPFFRRLGRELPDFDLSVPGVTSISADLHKFGYCLLGVSTFSLRDRALREHQQFDFDDWPYGPYRSVTFAGTRPTSPIAAAWAVLRMLGEEGYLEIARGILRTTQLFVDGIRRIDGLEVLFEPELGVLNVVSPAVDVIAVADELTARGWPTARFLEPPALHFLMDRVDDEAAIHELLRELAAVVEDVRAGRVQPPETGGGIGYESVSRRRGL